MSDNNNPIWGKWFNSIRNGVLYGHRPQENQTIIATDGLKITTAYKDLLHRASGSGGPVTITANPQINNGFDGQQVTLEGTNNTNTLTLQHGNGLQLSTGTNCTLGEGDMLTLRYNKARNLWIEVTRSINN
jgi:hypothetical protein